MLNLVLMGLFTEDEGVSQDELYNMLKPTLKAADRLDMKFYFAFTFSNIPSIGGHWWNQSILTLKAASRLPNQF